MGTAHGLDDSQMNQGPSNNYIVGPCRTAMRLVSAELSELREEEKAFESFMRSLQNIEANPVSANTQIVSKESDHQSKHVRKAYAQTFMNIGHFDEVYDEGLLENAAHELGKEVAMVMNPTSDVLFSQLKKQLLICRSHQAIEKRQNGIKDMTAEKKSLQKNKDIIRDQIDSVLVEGRPNDQLNEVQTKLDEILYRRQDFLSGKSRKYGDHTLWQYLYNGQEWTYPVLTSIARFCEQTGIENKNTQPK